MKVDSMLTAIAEMIRESIIKDRERVSERERLGDRKL